jgi:hypothetical protein
MPIEVRELIIRATVSQEANGAQKSASKDEKSPNEEIIRQCVAKVMEIIRNKNGR